MPGSSNGTLVLKGILGSPFKLKKPVFNDLLLLLYVLAQFGGKFRIQQLFLPLSHIFCCSTDVLWGTVLVEPGSRCYTRPARPLIELDRVLWRVLQLPYNFHLLVLVHILAGAAGTSASGGLALGLTGLLRPCWLLFLGPGVLGSLLGRVFLGPFLAVLELLE